MSVETLVLYQAVCHESGCTWSSGRCGHWTQAEDLAQKHRVEHSRKYTKEQEILEVTDGDTDYFLYEPMPGTTIEKAAHNAVVRAGTVKPQKVALVFNETAVLVEYGDKPDDVVERWWRRFHHA